MSSYSLNLNCQDTTFKVAQRKKGKGHPVLSLSLLKLCIYLMALGNMVAWHKACSEKSAFALSVLSAVLVFPMRHPLGSLKAGCHLHHPVSRCFFVKATGGKSVLLHPSPAQAPL